MRVNGSAVFHGCKIYSDEKQAGRCIGVVGWGSDLETWMGKHGKMMKLCILVLMVITPVGVFKSIGYTPTVHCNE